MSGSRPDQEALRRVGGSRLEQESEARPLAPCSRQAQEALRWQWAPRLEPSREERLRMRGPRLAPQ
ncbi:hypothetical protein [Myxococcus stipitatus]|uniref:hypothetical protein n=1 Tax=Myxococcus stipitatus TaxID=83455 RepID=UPI00146EE09B|nr:hypothetical protein [Myxococcus stipitatus]